jgi:hypothetical protein
MTIDEIIHMAKEAGMPDSLCEDWFQPFDSFALKFAYQIAAAEREACAKFIEQEYVRQFDEPWRDNLAKAIRARREQ